MSVHTLYPSLVRHCSCSCCCMARQGLEFSCAYAQEGIKPKPCVMVSSKGGGGAKPVGGRQGTRQRWGEDNCCGCASILRLGYGTRATAAACHPLPLPPQPWTQIQDKGLSPPHTYTHPCWMIVKTLSWIGVNAVLLLTQWSGIWAKKSSLSPSSSIISTL